MPVDTPVVAEALAKLTRRPVEMIDATTFRAALTHCRFLEVHAEPGGTASAWAIARIEIAGRLVESHVFIGDLFSALDTTKMFRRATDLLAEVVANGSRAATLIGSGTTAKQTPVWVYAFTAVVDPKLAAQRFSEYVARSGIVMADAETATTKKPAAKSKARAA
jgi:hypothetical protein